MKFVSIDSMEENFAVCEDDEGKRIDIDFKDLPLGIFEGAVLVKNESEKWTINEKLTKERKQKILDLRKSIYGK